MNNNRFIPVGEKSRIMNIQYKLVEEEHDKFKRFAAFDVTNPNDSKPLSIQQWLDCFSGAESNRQRLLIQEMTDLINSSTTSYNAYFFETKGVSMTNASTKQFEFVLVHSRQLSTFCEINGPTPETFQEYLDECSETKDDNMITCCSFPNLGHTATLIAPKNLGNYSHIGKFMNNASKEEIYQMWKKVTVEFLNELNRDPSKSLWLSTSGLGVSWLHFRIDETPKYYTYRQFALET